MPDPLERIVHNELAMARTPEAYARAEAKQGHMERAQYFLRLADEWVDVDEATLTERGYGLAKVYIGLADLHLRIRELL